MSIHTKIEEIRGKPEHIRMRYLLGSVAFSMLIIIVLWVFSITTSFQKQQETAPIPTQTNDQTQQNIPDNNISNTTPSLNEWIKK
jgi:hypothetical protein